MIKYGKLRILVAAMIVAELLSPRISFAAGVLNVKSYGAAGNGTTDDLAAVNTALSAACSSGEPLYFPAGTYALSSVPNNQNCSLTIYGDGSTTSILNLVGNASGIQYNGIINMNNGGSLTAHDLGFQINRLAAVGLQLQGLDTVTLYNVVVQNAGKGVGYNHGFADSVDCIYMHGVKTVNISYSVFTGCERSGIEMIPVVDATLSANIVSNNGYYGIVSECPGCGSSTYAGLQDKTAVVNNNILWNDLSGGIDIETDSGAPGFTANYQPVNGTAIGNDIENDGFQVWPGIGYGVVLGNSAYGIMSHNIVNNYNTQGTQQGSAIGATPPAGQNVTITNNFQSGSVSEGIDVEAKGGGATITGNWVTGNAAYGLYVYGLSGATIQNNYSYNNSQGASNLSCSGCTTSPNFTTPPLSTTLPSAPTGLTISNASMNQIDLSWTASTPGSAGVKGYYIYRDGIQLTVPTGSNYVAGTQYADYQASPGTTYTYKVVAFDGNGNVSGAVTATGTTLGTGGTPGNACDLNHSGTVDATDVQLCANQAIKVVPCTNGDLNQDGVCNAIDVQRAINAALGGTCHVGP